MYIVQKRNSERAQWSTCSFKGRKCRYEYLPQAWEALRHLRQQYSDRAGMQFQILDGVTNKVVE